MCTGVIIRRDGLRDIHCGSVRELARWFPVIVPDNRDLRPGEYPTPTIDRAAEHCLCPVDIQASATASGYSCEPDAGYMDYICVKSA